MLDLIHAIDRFIAEANNFETVHVEYQFQHYNADGNLVTHTYCPRFIAEVEWTCYRDHMIEKWNRITANTRDASAYMIRFYCELDVNNKEKLLQWIIDHGEHYYLS